MNETEWQTHAADLLQWLRHAAERGGDFVSEQTPLVIQEYVTYARMTSTVLVVLGVVMMPLVLILWRASHRAYKTGDDDDAVLIPGLLSVLPLIAAAGIIGSNIDDCVKAWAAPRVLVLEKVSELSGLGE